jgi:hypothetical protein
LREPPEQLTVALSDLSTDLSDLADRKRQLVG